MAAVDADVEERGGAASYPLPNSKLREPLGPRAAPPQKYATQTDLYSCADNSGPALARRMHTTHRRTSLCNKSIRGGTLNINLNAFYFFTLRAHKPCQ